MIIILSSSVCYIYGYAMLIYSKHCQVMLFCPGFLMPEYAYFLHEDDVLLWSTVVALLEASSPAQEVPGLLSILASARPLQI